MRIRRALFVILSLALIMAAVQGCGLLPSRVDLLNALASKEHKENLETSQNLLDCFSNKNAEGLKELLCARTRDLADTDEQILAGLNFFTGSVVSFDEDSLSSTEDLSTNYGVTTRLSRAWNINDITTDTGDIYKIYVHKYYVWLDDDSREGIALVTIHNSDGEKLTIGYKWPNYDNEGRDMSVIVVRSFSENDVAGLKDLLCAQTFEIEDIDQQIQEAFDFFEDKIIDCMVTGMFGQEYYDGSRSWHWSVSDRETIINGEPVSIFIDVRIYDIKMDNGNEYEIKLYACLLNLDDMVHQGISQIIITDSKGDERTIGERITQ